MSLGLTDKLKKSPKIKKIAIDENGAAVLLWTKVDGAEKYAVKRSASPNGEYETICWVKKTEYIDGTIEKDSTYWYKITAWKKLEGKKTSTKTSGVMAVVLTDIKAPENIKIIAQKKPAIKIQWKNIKGVDGCIISRRNDFYKQILPVDIIKGESYIDEGIVSGQVYHYSLQYFKNGEKTKQGAFSEEMDCIHLDSGAILSLKGSLNKKKTLSLRLVAGADGYILLRSDKKDGEFKEIARTSSGFDLKITDKVPKCLKTYYYAVCAYKIVNDSEFRSHSSKIVSSKGK